MRIAIVTLPLHTNYGGLLQAYALKTVLEGIGNDVTVLDMVDKMPAPKGLRAPLVYGGRMLRRLLKGKNGNEVFRERRYRKELPVLASEVTGFVDRYISPRPLSGYGQIKEGEYDAFVVGSDQVWRPIYFPGIQNAYLAFTQGWDVKRVAYAASFGTDELEYEYIQLETCARLLESFDGVSVREDSAVGLCEQWLDCDKAVHVLDPVMLLPARTYRKLAEEASRQIPEGRMVTYILDKSPGKAHLIDFVSKVSGLEQYDVSVNPYTADRPLQERIVPPVQNWLAAFAEAEFVVTDSFHGCVLAILMHKRFLALGNSRRGMARLSSLLNMFGLDMRLVQGIDPEDDGEFFLSDIDWEAVDEVLDEKRALSLEFLKKSLAVSQDAPMVK